MRLDTKIYCVGIKDDDCNVVDTYEFEVECEAVQFVLDYNEAHKNKGYYAYLVND